MSDFIDKLLAGNRPHLKAIWQDKIDEIMDGFRQELVSQLADPTDEDCASDRCRLKLESAMREISMLKADKTEADYRLSVVKAERDAVKKKLDGIRQALGPI